MKKPLVALLFLAIALQGCHTASTVTRTEALEIAERYRTHRWRATSANRLHGTDPNGIRVDTPDIAFKNSGSHPGWWRTDRWNVGVPYQWGGFSSLRQFDAGVAKGHYAGDVYTSDKRRQLHDAVSSHAVGVDCSGFVSRCWKLPRAYSTRELPSLCEPLGDYNDLRPGDILNTHNSHVMLFESFADPQKTRLFCYETGSPPTWKVMLNETPVAFLKKEGFKPYRYRGIR